ncbi:MAG: hypothetical protein QGD88_09200 [Anaerolineae bacterium]|nr:hypothetical protein [Anaerolineae bacterium]MDK1081641.1 hypothetical protein [Anaerolineae bacterium]
MSAKRYHFKFISLTIGILIVLIGGAFTSFPSLNLEASADTPPGPDRYTSILVDYTIYTWWMARFTDNSFVCEIITDHEGLPTLDEVHIGCGEDIFDDWFNQDPCVGKINQCNGNYIYQVDAVPSQREVAVELPVAEAWIDIEDCYPLTTIATNLCEQMPKLVITGFEPLPNEETIGISGRIDGEPFSCDDPCRIRLAPTDEDGVNLEFWAYSSYGDSSKTYEAQVRVKPDNGGNPDQTYWYVDVLSSQWTGVPIASCAHSWESFPPVGGPPTWLTTPKRAQDLSTKIPYNYLAANLILAGLVDANSCANGGLFEDSFGANTCGLELAYPAVTEWQNRFDNLILEVAHETGVPAQLLKRLFARESQFWPALYEGGDVGLGQLTEDGADTTLLWNYSFYEQFCPLVLSSDRCEKGYLHIDEQEQEMLRIGLINSVNATCVNCPLGIDLPLADVSVSIFGHTMLANCDQAGRIVRNVSNDAPGKVASYEDLWKFTLVNYNAGPGCLGDAIQATRDNNQAYEWQNVAANLEGVCSLGSDYVEDISN